MPSRGRIFDDAVASIPTVGSKVGRFLRRDGVRAVVQVGGTQVSLPFLLTVLPPVNHPVQVESRDGALMVSGLARPLPDVGQVTAVAGTALTVLGWGTTDGAKFQAQAGYLGPAVGQRVHVSWGYEGAVADRVLDAAAAPPPTPADPGPSDSGNFNPRPFLAVDSGSFDGEWVTNDVHAAPNMVSAWWYGPGVADSIPDDARIVSASIYLPFRQTLGGMPRLRLHTDPVRPGGAPAFTNAAVTVPAVSGWAPVPLNFIDYLAANRGGLGFEHGGDNIAFGTQRDALSGALNISWSYRPIL